MRLKLLLKAFLQRKAQKETDLLPNFIKFSRNTSYYFFKILFHKIESEGTLLNSFSKASEILISNPFKTTKERRDGGRLSTQRVGGRRNMHAHARTHVHTHTESATEQFL